MAPRKASAMMDGEIQRQLGRLEEAQSRAAEDRTEIKDALKEFRDIVVDLKGSFLGLSQTLQSTTNQVVSLNQEKCGERLTRLETELGIYKKILGSGGGLVFRLIGSLILSAAAGGIGTFLISGGHHP